MADPDWIGPPVRDPYWSADGRSVYYSLKRAGSPIVDLHRVDIGKGQITWSMPRPWRMRMARRCTIVPARAPPSFATAMCSFAMSPTVISFK